MQRTRSFSAGGTRFEVDSRCNHGLASLRLRNRLMRRRIDPEIIALVAAVGGLLVYRATYQSITYDEACTYLEFVNGSWREAWTTYTANNHVLFTLLAKLSTTLLGVNELTLRLPTLLGAALYLTSAIVLCHRMARSRGMAFLGVTALVLNPFVLDFLVAARGYGLALGLLLGALVLLTGRCQPLRAPRRCALVGASLALGLVVAANPAFVIAAGSVMACAAAIVLIGQRQSRLGSLSWLVLPGVFIAAGLLAVPLSHARRDHFFYGAETLAEGIRSLLTASLQHHRTAIVDVQGPIAGTLVNLLASGAVPLGALLLAVVGARRFRIVCLPSEDADYRHATVFVLIAGATLLAPLLAVSVHIIAGVPYPQERTALYLIPLFTLALVGSVGTPTDLNTWSRRWRASPIGLLGCALLSVYTLELNTSQFRTWSFDASSRRLFMLAQTAHEGGACPAHLAASWVYEPSLRFYATTVRTGCPLEVARGWQPGTRGYDVYVVAPGPDSDATASSLDILQVDALTGATIAVERDGPIRALSQPGMRPVASGDRTDDREIAVSPSALGGPSGGPISASHVVAYETLVPVAGSPASN
jgi:hypothetical protein